MITFCLFKKIPVAISPFFWVTAALIGWMLSGFLPIGSTLIAILIWVVIIFISILVHELGHASMARAFGQKSRIELVPFGGLTRPEGGKIKKWQEFLVILNGPLFGLGLFFLGLLALSLPIRSNLLYSSIAAFTYINIYWTVINLVPIPPLDGGQLMRVILEGIFHAKGIRYAHFFGLALSTLLCLGSFFVGFFIMGIIFSIFAFYNFNAWKRFRVVSESDQDQDLTLELKEIEDLLMQERTQEAIPRLEEIRKKSKKGVIFTVTSQYLASLKAREKKYREVYDLLEPIKKHISAEAQLQLHFAAYEVSDYPLVIDLAASCFRLLPDPLVALHNAEAYAALSQTEPAIGWLKAAHKSGVEDLKEVLTRSTFDPIRSKASFQAFTRSLLS